MNRSTFHALLLTLAMAATHAAASDVATYRIDQTHSSVEFSISKWHVTRQSGVFRELGGTIRMAPARPETARVEIRVDATSLDTRNATRDSVVRSEDFLDVDRHPHLAFRSTAVRRTGPAAFDVTGELTIRGVTRRVVAPVEVIAIGRVRGMGEIASFETTFIVDRREFGVLGSRWSGGRVILGDEVTVTLRIVARRVD